MPAPDRPLPSSFDDNEDFYNENAFQKITRKLKQEPLIPLGCILTVAAFTGAYRAMRRGDHNQVNRMFRARVAAQGFTVLAMVAGGIYFQDERHKERKAWQKKRDDEAEEKRKKWIRELETRDEEDRMVKERLEKRRQNAGVNAARREAQANAAEGKAGDGAAAAAAVASDGSEGKSPGGSGVLASLSALGGGWFGSSGKQTGDTSPESKESGEAKPTEKPGEK